MSIWKKTITQAEFDAVHRATLPGLLGIVLTGIAPDHARAEMPVDDRHVQPFGILHGGANVVLSETLGSFCGQMAVEEGRAVVGVEVNANHLAAVRKGDRVSALCRPIRLGRTLQVWEIEIRRGDGTLTCVSRLTAAVREAGAAG